VPEKYALQHDGSTELPLLQVTFTHGLQLLGFSLLAGRQPALRGLFVESDSDVQATYLIISGFQIGVRSVINRAVCSGRCKDSLLGQRADGHPRHGFWLCCCQGRSCVARNASSHRAQYLGLRSGVRGGDGRDGEPAHVSWCWREVHGQLCPVVDGNLRFVVIKHWTISP
jgi:hypothetical protein